MQVPCRQGSDLGRRLLLPPVPASLAMSCRQAVIETVAIPLRGAPAGRLSVDIGRAPRGIILLQSAADGHRPRERQRPRIRRIKLSAMPTNPTERSEGARRVGLPALLMPFFSSLPCSASEALAEDRNGSCIRGNVVYTHQPYGSLSAAQRCTDGWVFPGHGSRSAYGRFNGGGTAVRSGFLRSSEARAGDRTVALPSLRLLASTP